MSNPYLKVEDQITELLNKGRPVEAYDYIISVLKGEEKNDINIKLLSISYLTYLASDFFLKGSDEMNFIKSLGKAEKLIKELKSLKIPECELMLLNFEASLNHSRFTQKLFKGYDVSQILLKHLQHAIANYWRALRICNSVEEEYNIRNNLANCLIDAGRYVEASSLLKENMRLSPERFQSIASWGHVMEKLKKNALLPEIPSFYFVLGEHYLKAHRLASSKFIKDSLQEDVERCKRHLLSMKLELTDENLEENRRVEEEQFSRFSEYRKFVLTNGLGLNEHALHCFCANSEQDNLSIGLYSGSTHLKNKDDLLYLERYLNRLKSEFSFARLLYYKYQLFDVSSSTFYYEDDYSNEAVQEDHEILGYQVEHLRTSYRILYGLLDKVASAVLLHYRVSEGSKSVYFEDVFSQFESELMSKTSIHLRALRSLSFDLSQSIDGIKVGSLGFYKKIRNKMEHGLLILTKETTDDSIEQINIDDFQKFLLDLMRFCRSAIFSLNYLIRTESFISENEVN